MIVLELNMENIFYQENVRKVFFGTSDGVPSSEETPSSSQEDGRLLLRRL
jgi:hypothetical protein